MTSGARNKAEEVFTDKSSGCDVFLVSLKAGNVGLNLVEASNVIIMDPFWNPFVDKIHQRVSKPSCFQPVRTHKSFTEACAVSEHSKPGWRPAKCRKEDGIDEPEVDSLRVVDQIHDQFSFNENDEL